MGHAKPSTISDTPFVNEVRLNARHWIVASGILAMIVLLTPALWKKLERFEPGPDYRIPYALSKDYWLYERRLQQIAPTNVVVLGDSVVWGEYVRPDGTLSHFLNEQSGQPGRFVNGGVNGLFPLAFEGLIRCYGKPLSHHKVILHCNVLWMSSPKADLRTDKEERFNHAYFGQKSIPNWTLEDDGRDPPHYPNSYKNPFAQITFMIPTEPAVDPERGPNSPRHKPWSTTGTSGSPGEGSTRFEWVELDQSLQWAAFQRLVKLLQSRDNDVLVVVGPFNENIMAGENRPAFRRLRDGIVDWLVKNHVPHVVPVSLPSALYADASHPLTEGYEQLASRLYGDAIFRNWLKVR